MLQRLSLLFVIVLTAAACGGGGTTVTSAPSAPRALPAPDVELAADETISDDGVARVSDSPDGTDPCSSLERGITGVGGHALYEAQADGADAQAGLLADAFGGFGPTAIAHTETIAAFDGTLGSADAYLKALDGLDQLTLDECAFPGGAALFTTLGSMALTKFSCIDAAIGGDEPEPTGEGCGPPAQVFPDVLPCFQALGGSWTELAEGGDAPWEVVDCDTGESVMWDHDQAAWVPLQRVPSFEEISDTIGD